MVQMIPLTRPYFDQREADQVASAMDSGWVAGQGPKSKELEANFTRYVGAKHGVALNNCTAALHLALLALNVGPQDEVVVSDFTFPATGHAALYCGAKPVFCDAEESTGNMDPKILDTLVTEKTKAIIAVHAFGLPCDLKEITRVCQKHGVPLVEDAACAAGSEYGGRKVGTFGKIGCFSFHARKNMTTGEGGMLLTQDETVSKTVRQLSCFGMASAFDRQNQDAFVPPTFDAPGYNYKLSDILAGIGLAQLEKLDRLIDRKNQLAAEYEMQLAGLPLQTPKVPTKDRHSWQSYVVKLDASIDRNRLVELLRKEGVQTQIGTYASHIQPVYRSKQNCPQSLAWFQQGLALPIYYEMTVGQVQTVARTLKAVISKAKK